MRTLSFKQQERCIVAYETQRQLIKNQINFVPMKSTRKYIELISRNDKIGNDMM